MEEDGKVFYRFGKNSICSILPIDILNDILPRHPTLKKKFLSFKRKTIMMDKPFPLDYIMNLPNHLKVNDVDPAY